VWLSKDVLRWLAVETRAGQAAAIVELGLGQHAVAGGMNKGRHK
jgi:hypothetical protein